MQSITIDLFITGLFSNHLSNFRQGRLFSDHHLLDFSLTTSTKVGQKKMICYCKLEEHRHYQIWLQCGKQSGKCQPEIHVIPRVCLKIRQPLVVLFGWICNQAEEGNHRKQENTLVNDMIRKEIECCGQLEWNWRKNKFNKDSYLDFYCHCHLVSNMLDNAKREYYRSSLSEHKFVFKWMFNTYNGLPGRDKDLPLPPCDSNHILADQFNTFFHHQDPEDKK